MLKFSRQSNKEHRRPNPPIPFYPENQITLIYHIKPNKSNQPQLVVTSISTPGINSGGPCKSQKPKQIHSKPQTRK